ncbi:MAG: cation:proton antiporter [Bacteroidetes bacterium]|nr:cation:proton antiporter [Bacteroidota bacterium]
MAYLYFGDIISVEYLNAKLVPDVLGLMLIGILIGPVFHLIDPSTFGKFGSLFSNLVLIFILFESGTDLKISEVKESSRVGRELQLSPKRMYLP